MYAISMEGNTEKIRVGKAAKMLGVTIQTLRNWEKSGKLRAGRTKGGQRYYELSDLRRFLLDLKKLGWAWASSGQAPDLFSEYYCDRQDRFSSRLAKMGSLLQQSLKDEDLVSLLVLVAGEIGDNAFAHNIGNWPDTPGIFFAYDLDKQLIVLADRGRGVRATLQRVRPAIRDDRDALKVAFTEIVSGRDPEQRGNGLKVVRKVCETKPIGLLFRSGLGIVQIPREPHLMEIMAANENIRGVYSVIIY